MNKTLFKYFMGCSPDNLPETVIISPVFPPKSFMRHCRVRADFKGMACQGIIAFKNNKRFAVIYCKVGSGFSGDTALLLASSGVNKIIFIGLCGGLADSRIGDIVICENAFNGEGFTRYHEEPFNMKDIFASGKLISADKEYVKTLSNFLQANLKDGAKLATGDIFTIGSLMAEKEENIRRIEEEGYIGIEMELSSVYHASRIAGKSSVGLTVVSDLPLKKPLGERLTKEEKSAYNNSINEVIRVCVEFAVS